MPYAPLLFLRYFPTFGSIWGLIDGPQRGVPPERESSGRRFPDTQTTHGHLLLEKGSRPSSYNPGCLNMWLLKAVFVLYIECPKQHVRRLGGLSREPIVNTCTDRRTGQRDGL